MPDEVIVTRHAAERYIERVKPGLTIEQATRELKALVLMDVPSLDPPAWKAGPAEVENPLYVEPCDGIALALVGRAVVTVLTRAAFGPELTAKRRADKRRRRASKRFKRDAGQVATEHFERTKKSRVREKNWKDEI